MAGVWCRDATRSEGTSLLSISAAARMRRTEFEIVWKRSVSRTRHECVLEGSTEERVKVRACWVAQSALARVGPMQENPDQIPRRLRR
jgi:hypothetical protein